MQAVVINGEAKDVTSKSLADLIVELGLSNKKLAVELNRKIVPRDSYLKTVINTGDSLEIVHFIGGG